MIRVKPYNKLAEIYDQLMDHVDYDQWSSYVLRLINKYHHNPQFIIDLSCGTGNFFLPLYKHFKSLIGCDLSIEMVYQSMKKVESERISLFVNDIQEMAIADDRFDCALLLYDSLNYILDEKLLEKSLKEINRILKKGGIFIFDIVSDFHCREYYANNDESEYWDDLGYSRHSYYDEGSSYQYTEFRIVLNGHTFFEEHKQRIYSTNNLKEVLKKSTFEVMEVNNNFPQEEVTEDRSGRTHFVCRKM